MHCAKKDNSREQTSQLYPPSRMRRSQHVKTPEVPQGYSLTVPATRLLWLSLLEATTIQAMRRSRVPIK